jgi:hypothetical protein
MYAEIVAKMREDERNNKEVEYKYEVMERERYKLDMILGGLIIRGDEKYREYVPTITELREYKEDCTEKYKRYKRTEYVYENLPIQLLAEFYRIHIENIEHCISELQKRMKLLLKMESEMAAYSREYVAKVEEMVYSKKP